MMKKIFAKLRSRSGASIILVLVLFLICVMVASVVVAAASAGASRNVNRTRQQQGYLSITSAVELAIDEMAISGKFVGKARTVDYGCNAEGVKQYTATHRNETILSKHEHDITELNAEGIWSVDAEKTELDGVFKKVLLDACTAIYVNKQNRYTTTFVIESTDERLMDVSCEFTMDEEYNITMEFTGADTNYAMTLKLTGTPALGEETKNISCTHQITYDKVNHDGSMETNQTGTIRPAGVEVIKRTTITWGLPTVTKGVGVSGT